jgi:putative transposase
MTPAEAWEAMLDREHQFRLSELELRMLFMPAVLRTAKRGEVQFFNQVYFSRELMAVDGRQVRVHYDIHNPNFVLVFDLDGNYVCQADWNANRREFFAKPVVEMAREKRVDARMKRLQGQMDLAQRVLQGTRGANVISLPEPGAPSVLVPDVQDIASASLRCPDGVPLTAQPSAAGRPFFDTPSERYEWLMHNASRWDDGDREWIGQYVASEDYAALAEYFASRGIQWKQEGAFKSAR